MPLSQTTLKRQLDRANQELTHWIKALDARGVTGSDRRRDTKWRQLNAACNAIRSRLKAVAAVATRDADAAQRKAERLAAPVEEKVHKPKGAKTAKAPKPPKDKTAAKKPEKTDKSAEAGDKKKKK